MCAVFRTATKSVYFVSYDLSEINFINSRVNSIETKGDIYFFWWVCVRIRRSTAALMDPMRKCTQSQFTMNCVDDVFAFQYAGVHHRHGVNGKFTIGGKCLFRRWLIEGGTWWLVSSEGIFFACSGSSLIWNFLFALGNDAIRRLEITWRTYQWDIRCATCG